MNSGLKFGEPPKEYDYEQFNRACGLITAMIVSPLAYPHFQNAIKFQNLANQVRVFCGDQDTAESIIQFVLHNPNQFENITYAIDLLKEGTEPQKIIGRIKERLP